MSDVPTATVMHRADIRGSVTGECLLPLNKASCLFSELRSSTSFKNEQTTMSTGIMSPSTSLRRVRDRVCVTKEISHLSVATVMIVSEMDACCRSPSLGHVTDRVDVLPDDMQQQVSMRTPLMDGISRMDSCNRCAFVSGHRTCLDVIFKAL